MLGFAGMKLCFDGAAEAGRKALHFRKALCVERPLLKRSIYNKICS
jgi:hypothetical protein